MSMNITRRTVLAGGAGLAVASIVPFRAFAAPRRIIVQGGSPSANVGYIPIFVAQEAGFFAEENLDIEVRFSRGAPLAAQIVNSGDADIGNFTYEPLIQGYSQGLRGKYYYQFYNKTIYFLGVPESAGVASPSALAGKRIGVASLSSAALPVARAILQDAGVDPSSVTFVPVGVGGQVLSALRANQVDALALWDAAYGALESLGERFAYFRHPKLSTIGNGGYLASEAMLAERAEDLNGYARACAKATAFFFANPEAAIQLYWKRNPAGKNGAGDEEAMKNALAETRHLMEDIAPVEEGGKPVYGRVKLDEVQNYIDIFAAEAEVASAPAAGDIAVEGFAEAANDFDLAKVQQMAKDWKG